MCHWGKVSLCLPDVYHGSVRCLCEGSMKCSLGSVQCGISTRDMLVECHLKTTSVRATSECLLPTLGGWHISFLLFTRYKLFSIQEFLQSVKFINSSDWKNKMKQCLEIPRQHRFPVSEITRRTCKGSFWTAQTLTQPRSLRRVQQASICHCMYSKHYTRH